MTASTTTVTATAMLFDMDGTLLDSTAAVEATWEFYAKKYNLNVQEVLKTSHGVRTVDNLKRWCGHTDGPELEEAAKAFESMIVTEAQRLQSEGKTGLVLLPGVHELLSTLETSPKPVWTIVTSATTIYASAALPTAGVPDPPHLITAEAVSKGKPYPDPYLAGAAALGVPVEECIVVEDAPSGVKSGVAAKARVLAVCTSHDRGDLQGLGASWIVTDLSKVRGSLVQGKVSLEIDETP